MSVYLQESRRADGSGISWQTPFKQRLLGLFFSLAAMIVCMYGVRNAGTTRGIDWEITATGGVFLLASILATLWTVKVSLDFRSRTYQRVKGFLPILIGHRGPAEEIAAVSIRKEEITETKGMIRAIELGVYRAYRVFLVWKDARQEAFLVDSFPSDFAASLTDEEFHARALDCAEDLGNKLGIPVLDSTRDAEEQQEDETLITTHAAVQMPNDAPVRPNR